MRLLWKTTIPCTFPSESALIKECFWNGHPVNCSILFQATPTDTGMCCSFNLAPGLSNGTYKDIVEELQIRANPVTDREVRIDYLTILVKK